MSLRNKRILITAGPTWVPIDAVRVISNIATGETGILLAQKLARLGAKVTLVLGPAEVCCLHKKIRFLRFKSFEDLRAKINKELRLKKYDAIIHSAAVSDFKPVRCREGKIKSERHCAIKLIPLPKIIRDIRNRAQKAKLVMFKLESTKSDATLISRSKKALVAARADFVVANRVNPYRAFIIDKKFNISAAITTKEKLVPELLKKLTYDLPLTT